MSAVSAAAGTWALLSRRPQPAGARPRRSGPPAAGLGAGPEAAAPVSAPGPSRDPGSRGGVAGTGPGPFVAALPGSGWGSQAAPRASPALAAKCPPGRAFLICVLWARASGRICQVW